MIFFKNFVLKNKGYCSTCDSQVTFAAENEWLRDHYICMNCGSIPRERALMQVIETYYPEWKNLTIHESSPGYRGASLRMSQNCGNYIISQYFQDQPLGSMVNGTRCESLEELTFPDESVDLQITQDVMEHIFTPSIAFSEIARILKPGGAHIFTVPLVNKTRPSELRAQQDDNGKAVHLKPAQYHGNPVSDKGSLVTVDWGFDICRYIFDACGLFTHMVTIDDPGKGIRAEFIEVLITFKPGPAIKDNPIP